MKKLLVIMIALVLVFPALADDNTTNNKENSNIKTLFGGNELHSGGYGGPELKVTTINSGQVGLMIGGRGGWIANSSFSIGGGGYGLVTNHVVHNYKDKYTLYNGTTIDTTMDVNLRFGYGGLFLEYINSSDEVIHFTINALIGGGAASYTSSNRDMMDYQHNDMFNNRNNNTHMHEAAPFFVFEPGATVDLNLTKFMRIGLGASYRMVWGLDLPNTTNKDLSGLSGNLIFKFGRF